MVLYKVRAYQQRPESDFLNIYDGFTFILKSYLGPNSLHGTYVCANLRAVQMFKKPDTGHTFVACLSNLSFKSLFSKRFYFAIYFHIHLIWRHYTQCIFLRAEKEKVSLCVCVTRMEENRIIDRGFFFFQRYHYTRQELLLVFALISARFVSGGGGGGGGGCQNLWEGWTSRMCEKSHVRKRERRKEERERQTFTLNQESSSLFFLSVLHCRCTLGESLPSL